MSSNDLPISKLHGCMEYEEEQLQHAWPRKTCMTTRMSNRSQRVSHLEVRALKAVVAPPAVDHDVHIQVLERTLERLHLHKYIFDFKRRS